MERIYVNFELEVEEYLDAVVGVPVRVGAKLYLASFVLPYAILFSTFNYQRVVSTDEEPIWMVPLVFAAVLPTLLAVLDRLIMPVLMRSLAASKARAFLASGLSNEVRGYIFQEDHWIQIFGGATMELQWSRIRRWRESEYSFVICLGAPEIPIPKRVCTKEKQEALRALLYRKVGPPQGSTSAP